MFINDEIQKLKPSVCKVMKVIKASFQNATIYLLGTIIRQNWYPLIRNQVPKLNLYMRLTHGAKVVQMNGYIIGEHLESDKIHLSTEGYVLFVPKALGPLLDGFYFKIRPRKVPVPYHAMTKAQRKRFVHNQRNKKEK